jgi:hypothetical protein
VATKKTPISLASTNGRCHLKNSKKPLYFDLSVRFKETFVVDKYCYILEKSVSEDRGKTSITIQILDIISKKILTRQSIDVIHGPHISNFSTGIFLLDAFRLGYRFNYLKSP